MGAISRKNPNRGEVLKIHFFEKTPGIFYFFTLTLEIPEKNKAQPLDIPRICVRLDHPLEISRPKTKTPVEIPHYFFWSPLEIPLRFY